MALYAEFAARKAANWNSPLGCASKGSGVRWRAVNPLVALVTSGLISTFLWIVVQKTVQAASVRPTHDLEVLPGLTGEAKSKIHEEGSVYVAGEMWSARSDDPIPAGSTIRVVRREGFILVVVKDS